MPLPQTGAAGLGDGLAVAVGGGGEAVATGVAVSVGGAGVSVCVGGGTVADAVGGATTGMHCSKARHSLLLVQDKLPMHNPCRQNSPPGQSASVAQVRPEEQTQVAP